MTRFILKLSIILIERRSIVVVRWEVEEPVEYARKWSDAEKDINFRDIRLKWNMWINSHG